MKVWILFQDTKDGGRYFTGIGHPISPDAWTSDIGKAQKYDWASIVNIREWVSAYTWGDPIQIIH